jgi:hypothetical protein
MAINPELMMIDGGGTTIEDIHVYWIDLTYASKTEISVRVYAGVGTIGSYGYEIVAASSAFTNTLTTATSSTFSITGLTAGAEYKIQARAFAGANKSGTYGDMRSISFTMPKLSTAGSILETVKLKEADVLKQTTGTTINTPSAYGLDVDDSFRALNPSKKISPGSEKQITRSLFQLSNNVKDSTNYTVAFKSFNNLSTTSSYYAFGTSLFFKSNTNNPNQSGGFGFFVGGEGLDGYFIKIDTTANAAANKNNEFTILKIKGGTAYPLEDSQQTKTKTLTGIYGGKTYKIDVRVKVTSTSRLISVYVNGFKITATDSNPSGGASSENQTPVLSISKRVAMMCNEGTVYFDYVYGMHLTPEQYEQESLFNIYDGQYSEAAISFLYGNKTLQNNTVSNESSNGFIEEFGAVARELRVLKTKYDSRPGFPLYASTGVNNFAKIIGQRLTSFGAEVYVLNNSGTFIPLDDSQFYSFYILGKYISQSGQLEYVDNAAGEYTVKEPVIFESNWIQKQTDVVSLADWIKNIWSVKQTIIQMEVFGNPLISVGDIITISDSYNALTTSQKFVVLNVANTFKDGLETSITCRTL